jgi:glycine betaine/proline transport system substrate-binding protein
MLLNFLHKLDAADCHGRCQFSYIGTRSNLFRPENEVSSIADLAKPSVAKFMSRTIQGIGIGATITTNSQKAVREYGLDVLGYTLRPGTPAEWTGAYDKAVAEKKWIVVPTWAPQYLSRDGKLRPLQDP